MKAKLLLACTLAVMCSCNSKGQQARKKPVVTNTSSFTGASDIVQSIPEKNYPGLKPGDIAADAVKIDADNIVAIINGACIIEKHGVQAMIDLKGNFLVPWGKYKFFVDSYRSNYQTLIHVSDPVGTANGYINTAGQVVVPLIYYGAGDFDLYKIAHVSTLRDNDIAIDNHGKVLPKVNYRPIAWNNLSERNFYNKPQATNLMNINVAQKGKQSNAIVPLNETFGDRYGKVTIQQKYYQTGSFSEGMCLVANIDQFNVVRWGYIDQTGKQVIPYTYIIKPGNFHNGLALVVPQEKTDFEYAYIDKTGNIKFKITHSQYRPDGRGQYSAEAPHDPNVARVVVNGDFFNGFAYWRGYGDDIVLLDTVGQFHKFAEIVKDPEIARSPYGLLMINHDDLGIYYQVVPHGKTLGGIGLVDYQGNTIFPPVFSTLKPDLYSAYAVAAVTGQTSPAADKRTINGIVNRQGVFVLVIGDKSTF